MKRKQWIIGGTTVALLLVALTVGGVAWAAAGEQEAPVARVRGLQAYVVRGTVTGVDGDRVAVETGEGASATLLITDTTRLWLPGEPLTATVELAVGDPVLALGQPLAAEDGDKTLLARLVAVVSDEDLPKVLIRGRVVAITEQTVVVQTGQRERAMTVTSRTRLLSASGRVGSLREIRPGEQIVALGQPTELGQWIAGLVMLPSPEPQANGGLRGTVIDKDEAAGTLAVETDRRGTFTVLTDEQTRYRIPGAEDPGLADVQVGDRIVALGHWEPDAPGVFHARGLAVLQP